MRRAILVLLSREVKDIINFDIVTFLLCSFWLLGELFTKWLQGKHRYNMGIFVIFNYVGVMWYLIHERVRNMSPEIQWCTLGPSKQSLQNAQKKSQGFCANLLWNANITSKRLLCFGENVFDLMFRQASI